MFTNVSETPERKADFSLDPVARMAMPSRVSRNHIQNKKRMMRIQTEVESPRNEALPSRIHPAGSAPPSIGRMSSDAPESIDQVARVTKNGWRRRTELRSPLAAPTDR